MNKRNSAPQHQHHIIVFFLCPLEENLHTYLSTWLSSCPVAIFYGFLIIFYLNQKIINKVQSIKCAILKSTHITFGFCSTLLSLESFDLLASICLAYAYAFNVLSFFHGACSQAQFAGPFYMC